MWGHVCQHCKLVPRWALESLSATWEGFHFSTQAWSITINWDGVRLWRDLKVKRSILNFIRSAIGSQCRSFNSSVTWSYFLEHVTIQTAIFVVVSYQHHIAESYRSPISRWRKRELRFLWFSLTSIYKFWRCCINDGTHAHK